MHLSSQPQNSVMPYFAFSYFFHLGKSYFCMPRTFKKINVFFLLEVILTRLSLPTVQIPPTHLSKFFRRFIFWLPTKRQNEERKTFLTLAKTFNVISETYHQSIRSVLLFTFNYSYFRYFIIFCDTCTVQ